MFVAEVPVGRGSQGFEEELSCGPFLSFVPAL